MVKKIDISKLRIKKDSDYLEVSTKTLAKLNITEDEPFQIIDEGGNLNGKFAIVQEFGLGIGKRFQLYLKNKQSFILHTYSRLHKRKKNT